MTGTIYKKMLGLSMLLLVCLQLLSQTGIPDSLEQKFTQYQLNNYQEKIFVHTDKTFYLAGEIIWFKVYNVDAYFNRPSEVSKICYVEIISKDHKPVLQAKIAMQKGNGNGSFMLPSSIASGNYTFRAYTNWMKNFDPDYFFEQTISIVNTLKQSAVFAAASKNSFDIQFFSEGGNLVAGLQSKIAFKTVNQFGEGINCTGTITNQKGDTLTTFRSLHLGMGNFIFTPGKDNIYKAIIKINDTVIVKQLPGIYDQGYVMSLNDASKDQVKISVHATGALPNPYVYLFVQSHNFIKSVQSMELVNGEAIFVADKNVLGDGINQFTVFNGERLPVCERLYFKKPEKKLVLEIKPDQENYSTRKKVSINLSSKDQSNQALVANLSMSVFLIDSLQSVKHADIFSYLTLSSELKGNIETPEYYFENNTPESAAAIDNLMLTQGWRRFKWQDVLQNRKPYFAFLPEREGLLISGKITDKKTGSGANNIGAWLTVPGENFVVGNAVSGISGDIKFNMHDFYGSNELIVQTNYKKDSSYSIDIANPYADQLSSKTPSWFSVAKTWKSELEYRSTNAQVENAYLVDRKQHSFSFNAVDTLAFYGNADKQYNLDDYTRFITMEEVMREYVTEIRVRKQADKFYFKASNLTYKTFFEDNPLVLMDGVPVSDINKVMDFDPLKVKRIDIVARKYYFGSSASDGIVSYKTYNGDLAGFQLDPNAVVVEYDGLQRQREFYSPVYETTEGAASRLPDFRNQLHWSAAIETGSDGKKELSFYTSDLAGKFAIIVQGFTPGGLCGSTVATINVEH